MSDWKLDTQIIANWDLRFFGLAEHVAQWSKDPSTKVGAVIVNDLKQVLSLGYNGFPRGCSDDELPWNREAEDELDTKYPVSNVIFGHLALCRTHVLYDGIVVCVPC